VRRAQPNDGARHAGLRPGPLIYDPRRETPQAPRPCTNAIQNVGKTECPPSIFAGREALTASSDSQNTSRVK
jgi:hypothetical protein